MEIVFHLLVWPFSLIMSIIPIFGHHYGAAGTWCWIKNETLYENILRLVCVYLWLILAVIIEMVCFAMIVCKIHQQLRLFSSDSYCPLAVMEKKQLYKNYVYPLLLYPLVNFFITIPVTVNRFQNWLSPDEPIFALYFLHCTLYPLWGFCNAVTYFASRETLHQLHPCAILDAILNSLSRTSSLLEPPSDQEAYLRHVDESHTDALMVNCNHAVEVDSNNLSVSDMD